MFKSQSNTENADINNKYSNLINNVIVHNAQNNKVNYIQKK